MYSGLFGGTISGRLVDRSDNPIVGVNVYLQGTVLGAASDDQGNFRILVVPDGTFTLTFSMIGFSQKDTLLTLQNDQTLELGEIVLNVSPLQSQPIIVTASKYEQSVQDVPASIHTITADQIKLRNIITVDKALGYVPGINMNSDQVNIRGSSGYSRGVGSRVMLLLDGIPYITGDTQGLVFEALPINNVDRVEVVKGAGSALYGSSAIGGVINIITSEISEEPTLNAKLYGGFFDDPYYSEWKWSDKTRFLNGIQLDYSRRIGTVGLRIAAARDATDSYRQNDWRRRYNISGKVEIDLSAFDLLTISGNYMDQKRANFLYWSGLKTALEPPEDQIGEQILSKRWYLSSRYRKLFDRHTFLKFDLMWFQNNFDDNVGIGNQSISDYLHMELQFNTKYNNHILTLGLTPSFSDVSSNIFGSRDGSGFAAYIQDEVKWSSDWISTFGLRYDRFNISELDPGSQLSPKVGIVYKPESTSAIRASIGSGFRAPSMAEGFTSTVAGGLTVEPNPELKPEQSFSAEIGWNKYFGSDIAMDIAVFQNYYWEMIEGAFQQTGNIQFDNITEARIIGSELSIQMRFLNDRFTARSSYTYIDPVNISNGKYLKYRPRHLFYNSGTFCWDMFLIGIDYRFISRYDQIDENFALVIPDSDPRVAAHIVDVHIAFDLESYVPGKISLQINNLLQYHYIDLVGSIAPIRNYLLTLETHL
jgi:iron complex outermembrane receptor protein